MIRLTKNDAREDLSVSGRDFILVSRTWAFHLRTPWFGFGADYQRPYRVETNAGSHRPIHDYLMWVRVGAAVSLLMATLTRRVGR